MRISLIRRTILLVVSMAVIIIMAGCGSSGTPISLVEYPHPVTVASVLFLPELINPGGPPIEMTLKNVSSEPIVALNAVLDENKYIDWDFSFDITPSNPLMPDELISSGRILINGGWGDGVSYSLTITGTQQNGETFLFTWEQPYGGDWVGQMPGYQPWG